MKRSMPLKEDVITYSVPESEETPCYAGIPGESSSVSQEAEVKGKQ